MAREVVIVSAVRTPIGSFGGALAEDVAYAAAWVPVSLVPQPDGSTLPFPHFYERGKPGYITVDATGRRFTNESASYHDFVPAMVEACASSRRPSASAGLSSTCSRLSLILRMAPWA